MYPGNFCYWVQYDHLQFKKVAMAVVPSMELPAYVPDQGAGGPENYMMVSFNVVVDRILIFYFQPKALITSERIRLGTSGNLYIGKQRGRKPIIKMNEDCINKFLAIMNRIPCNLDEAKKYEVLQDLADLAEFVRMYKSE